MGGEEFSLSFVRKDSMRSGWLIDYLLATSHTDVAASHVHPVLFSFNLQRPVLAGR